LRSRAARLDSHVRGEDEIKSLVCIALLTLCSAAANTTPNAWSDYKRLKAVSVGFGGRGGQVEPNRAYDRPIAADGKRSSAPNTPHTATSLNNLAALYGEQGRSSDAEPLFRRALAIREILARPRTPRHRH
jgi:hypothetical protein